MAQETAKKSGLDSNADIGMIIEHYHQLIKQIVAKKVHNIDDREDCVQQAEIKIVEAYNNLDAQGKTDLGSMFDTAYVIQIVKNTVIDYIRRTTLLRTDYLLIKQSDILDWSALSEFLSQDKPVPLWISRRIMQANRINELKFKLILESVSRG